MALGAPALMVPYLVVFIVVLWGAFLRVAALGDESCWVGPFQFDTCCLPPPNGNAQCWEGGFTFEYCCLDRGLRGAIDVSEIEDISVLGGCELNIYQEFKAHAGAWYRDAQPNLVLFREFDYLMARFDSVFKSCAAAALTALLVKLETIYFEEEWRWSELFSLYVERQHQAVASGTLLQSHHVNGWPLLEGVRKVNALRASGGGQNQMLDIVVCYCGGGERIDWLRGFQKLPWRNENRTESTRRFVSLRLYHKCGSSRQSEREVERDRLVAEWGDIFYTVEVRYVDDVFRADDCSAYLAYIVDRYDDLPEFTVFLHADAPEHIPTIDLLMDTVFAASRGYLPSDVGFVHFAHNYVHHNFNCSAVRGCPSTAEFEFSKLWKNVFGSSIIPSMSDGDLNSYCCVQFLVRRSRIHLRNKDFYKRALNYFGDTAESYFALFPVGRVVWGPDTRGRTPCQLAMYIWHVLFGEDMQLPRRHRDPRLPLFIQMLNIEVEAVVEAQAGADGNTGVELQLTGDTSPDLAYERLQTLFVDSKV